MENNKIELLTPSQVSEVLNIKMNKVYDLMKLKSFPSFRIGRRYYIEKSKLLLWLEKKSETK